MTKIVLKDVVARGGEIDATLSNGERAVRCEDVLYLDFVDDDAMRAVYEEWCELADAGEDGYYYVAA